MELCAVTERQVSSLKWGCGPTRFGRAGVAWTGLGICRLEFAAEADTALPAVFAAALQQAWPAAVLTRDDAAAAALLAPLFGQRPDTQGVRLAVRGTDFQLQVWQALLHTRPGDVLTYGELARRIGAPGAARAVGSALAANTIGWLIPCHRVVRQGGAVGQYRWLPARKAAMLAWEAQQPDAGL